MQTKHLLILWVLVGVIGALLFSSLCRSNDIGTITVSSLRTYDDQYLLLAPYRVDVAPNETKEGVVYLINRAGRVVHSWHTEAPVLTAHLTKDGSLYITMTPALSLSEHPNAGTTGILQKLSWSGEVIFEHKDPRMMIDFEVLPNGHITYMRWHQTPLWYGAQARNKMVENGVWANELVEIDEEGKEVWTWRLDEHVPPTSSRLSFVPPDDFSHTNSVRYISDNPLTHTEAYLVSARHLSTVYLIDKSTGTVLWQSKQGLLAFQHDATLLTNGNILAFDNGFARDGVSLLASRAVEFALDNQNVVWQYDGGNTATGKAQFATSIMGGAQRLQNGNTLITLSVPNRVLEVTPEGKTVWEFVYTKRDKDTTPRMLFRVQAYSGEGTSWKQNVTLNETFGALFCFAS